MFQVNFKPGLGLHPMMVNSKEVADYRKSSLVASIVDVSELYGNPKEIW